MDKRILLGSIIAVVILVLVSFTGVVGYQTKSSTIARGSPLFTVRSSRAIDEESEDIACDYARKGGIVCNPESSNNYPSANWIIRVGSISGGLTIKAKIANGYHSNLTNVKWSISLEDGIILLGRKRTGVIEKIPVDSGVTISNFVFGIGNIKITVIVETPEGASDCGIVSARIFGPFTYHFFRIE